MYLREFLVIIFTYRYIELYVFLITKSISIFKLSGFLIYFIAGSKIWKQLFSSQFENKWIFLVEM